MKKKIILCFCILVILTSYLYLINQNISYSHSVLHDKNSNLKYILQWTRPYTEPFVFMGKRQDTFIERRCSEYNCYVTSDRTLLKDLTDYDAVLFHGPELHRELLSLPTKRSPHQKYVFVSMESSMYYPLNHERYDHYFNWTWTYKLNSDEYFGYIIIKNKKGDVIGPKETMHWLKMEDMTPIDNKIKEKLKHKKMAAAWFVSNCNAPSGRHEFTKNLQEHLRKLNMTLDIYGRCGTKKCPLNNMEECLRKLETDYFFYLSFENSFSEDYVTEKLLHALKHHAVPIVYGGANYTRFMPDGIYLNARTLTMDELVKKMADLINDKERYYDLFRWHNHYSYHAPEDSPDTDSYCKFCNKISDANVVEQISVYEHFRDWWNPKL